mmetsp:Transcript_82550/g.163957  ORF Transcript_82550/g.163957 Transcript_82550/m.163957 type:complete len:208 (+) Transcript_82550:705-1328(+)
MGRNASVLHTHLQHRTYMASVLALHFADIAHEETLFALSQLQVVCFWVEKVGDALINSALGVVDLNKRGVHRKISRATRISSNSLKEPPSGAYQQPIVLPRLVTTHGVPKVAHACFAEHRMSFATASLAIGKHRCRVASQGRVKQASDAAFLEGLLLCAVVGQAAVERVAPQLAINPNKTGVLVLYIAAALFATFDFMGKQGPDSHN